MKVLVVTSEPVDDALVEELTEDPESIDDVRVLAPTLADSRLRYWLNDTDLERERAKAIAEGSVQQIEGAGLPASPEAATDDAPEVSVEDAVREFEPDRVVVLKHGEEEERYCEGALVDEIAACTDAPIDVRLVAADNA